VEDPAGASLEESDASGAAGELVDPSSAPRPLPVSPSPVPRPVPTSLNAATGLSVRGLTGGRARGEAAKKEETATAIADRPSAAATAATSATAVSAGWSHPPHAGREGEPEEEPLASAARGGRVPIPAGGGGDGSVEATTMAEDAKVEIVDEGGKPLLAPSNDHAGWKGISVKSIAHIFEHRRR